ncbi:MAG: PH domain-containing protein [Sandaracinaceae bacterium]|nr:PH domain-containing protein [Sandaracinaceae bacterium]
MTLIACPECAGRVSDRAQACPHCGFPVRDEGGDGGPERTLLAVSPRIFGGNWFMHALMIVLCLVIVGFVLYFIEWLTCRGTRLLVTTRRTTLQRGILDRQTNEVRHADVRNVRVTQSFVQRMFSVGTLEISSAGQSDVEISVKGLPDPQGIAKLIREQR